MGYNKNSTDTATNGTSTFNDRYDPDREYTQRLLANEGYGNQAVTGWDFNYYDPYQTGYAAGPHWNYVNNPDGPDPGKLGNPPGGVGTGGATPAEDPNVYNPDAGGDGKPPVNSGDPHDYTGMTLDQVNAHRAANHEGPINQAGLDEWNTFVAQERHGNPGKSFSDILGDWHTDQGYGVQKQYGGGQENKPAPAFNPNATAAPHATTASKVGTPGGGQSDTKIGTHDGPGTGPDNPWNHYNSGGPGSDGIGDVYGGDGPQGSGYYSTAPPGQGPGHGQWINGAWNPGVSGPMVRPADRNSSSIWAGPFNEWGQGGASGNRQMSGGKLYDSFNDLVQHPDLPQETKNAITTGANEASNARYSAAQGDLQRYGRTTGNRAGQAAGIAAMAKSRADDSSEINRKNAIDFEDERFKRQQAGLQGMGSLYKNEGDFLLSTLGARAGMSQKPLSGTRNTQGTGNTIASGFGLSFG
jgi:hypothetical protein